MNPFRSPTETQGSERVRVARGFAFRFAGFLVVMLMLNFVRLVTTWRAFHGDGLEQIGFPFVIYERGGFSYSETFRWQSLAFNAVVALVVAYFGAHISSDGFFTGSQEREIHRDDEDTRA